MLLLQDQIHIQHNRNNYNSGFKLSGHIHKCRMVSNGIKNSYNGLKRLSLSRTVSSDSPSTGLPRKRYNLKGMRGKL